MRNQGGTKQSQISHFLHRHCRSPLEGELIQTWLIGINSHFGLQNTLQVLLYVATSEPITKGIKDKETTKGVRNGPVVFRASKDNISISEIKPYRRNKERTLIRKVTKRTRQKDEQTCGIRYTRPPGQANIFYFARLTLVSVNW